MRRSPLVSALATLAGLIGLIVAVWILARDETALGALGALSVAAVAVVVIVQWVNVSTDSLRYLMVVPDRFRTSMPVFTWHRVFAVGRILNLVVPQAGTAYRATHLRIAHDLPLSGFFGSVAAISWLGNGVALLLAAVVLVTAGAPLPALAVAVAGLAILGVVAVVPRWSGSGRSRLPDRIRGPLAGFAETFTELARTPGRLGRVFSVSLVSQGAGAGAWVLVCAALGIDDPLVTGVVLYAGTTLVTVVALTPGGIGVAELGAGLVGVVLDIGAGPALLGAMVIRVTGLAAVTALGLLGWLGEAAVRRRGALPLG